MSQADVTVAHRDRDGGAAFAGALAALGSQSVPHELLVCDSGSRDGSAELARASGARVLELDPAAFNHGATRNLLMREAAGVHVALLTQDAEPRDERWLEHLLSGFELADDVALVYGPYVPRAQASPAVRLELERWFASLSPDGSPRLERLDGAERALPVRGLVGRRGFFTDANACVSRTAWERVPFRDVPYAEDRVLAIDMLRAGYAKVYLPDAAVLHSHDYTTLEQLRRSFDEWRGLREVYAWRESAGLSHLLSQLRGELASARADAALAAAPPSRRLATLAAVSTHHLVRLAGAVLGSRAEMLPAPVRRALSLEGRDGFTPLGVDAVRSQPPAQHTDGIAT
jgi:rhamnosyltransferase